MAGRATVIAVNPVNADEVYLGTANGGLWHTSHVSGVDPKWDPLFDGAIGSIWLEGCDVTVSNVCGAGTCGCKNIYVGTGENAVRRDTYYGLGVFLMTQRNTEPPFTFQPYADGNATLGQGAIGKLVVPPLQTASQTFYALVSAGVTASASESTVTAPAPGAGFGIYQSLNKGAWSKLNIPGVPAGALPTDFQVALDGTLYAAFMGVGIFRQNPSAAWCLMNGPNGTGTCADVTGLPANTTQASGLAAFSRVTLSIAPSDSKVMYASFGACELPGPVILTGPNKDLKRRDGGCDMQTHYFRSVTTGHTWSPLTIVSSADLRSGNGANLAQYPNYTHVLTIDPTTASVFWTGGLNMWVCQGDATSPTNLAYTCTAQGENALHPDVHDIVFANHNATVYAANDGGFAIGQFTGPGYTFKMANALMPFTQFQSVATNPKSDMIVGGTQDNALAIFNGSRAWDSSLGGDIGAVVLDAIPSGAVFKEVVYFSMDTGPAYEIDNKPAALALTLPPVENEARAFFPPLRQHPSTRDLYFATNRLYKSTDTVTGPRGTTPGSWLAVSPPDLAINGGINPDTETTNYITSIGLSPSDPNVVYIGFYNGQIFGSISGPPCASTSCWPQIGGGNFTPAAPVTSIAVDPTVSTTLYVTYSGFHIGHGHVFKNVGASPFGWSDFSSGLPDTPANVVAIEPSNSQNLWLGTDQGVFSTIMGSPSSIWSLNLGTANGFLIPSNLPSVPVYDLSIDEPHHRIVAATHGRGMWVLGAPQVYTKEGWVKMAGDSIGTIWDIPTFGTGFPPAPPGTRVPCTVELIQRSSNVCAKGATDSQGGTIFVNDQGVLTTANGALYDNKPVVWSCLNHKCLGKNPQNNQDSTIEGCNFKWLNGVLDRSTADPVSQVKVVCGGPGTAFPLATGVAQVSGCPALASPPGNIFSLDPPPATPSGSFQAVASVQIGGGGTRELCRTTVPFAGTELPADILARVMDRINAEPGCTAQGVQALSPGLQSPPSEDTISPLGVLIHDQTVTGGQVFLTVSAPPGQTTGLCFNANKLGDPASGALAIMRASFSTTPGGAKGGSITVVEASPIGSCKRTIVTNPGDAPATIAAGVEAAFQTSSLPGTVDCPANENPLDIVREGDSVITVLPSSITLCSNDTGVGFALAPEELMLKACTPLPVIYGSNSVHIEDGVVIGRVGGGFGTVASGGAGGVDIDSDVITGDVLSVGSVNVDSRARVNGLIETAGTVTLDPQGTVTGPILQHASLNLPLPQTLPTSFPASTGDLELEDGLTQALAPGSYGNVDIEPRSTLTLRAGTYYMQSLVLELNSTVQLDTTSGPVFIYIKNGVDFLGTFVDPLHTKSNLFIGYIGTAVADLDANFSGSFVAPSATLDLGGHDGSATFTGEFFARDIQIPQGATVFGQSFSCP